MVFLRYLKKFYYFCMIWLYSLGFDFYKNICLFYDYRSLGFGMEVYILDL